MSKHENTPARKGEQIPYEVEEYHYGGSVQPVKHDRRIKAILWVVAIMLCCVLISIILGVLKFGVDVCIVVASVCGVIALAFICLYYLVKSKIQKERIEKLQAQNDDLRSERDSKREED